MKRLLQLGLIAALLTFTVLALPTTNASTVHAASVTPHTDSTHCASLGTLLSPTIPLTADGITLGYINIYYNNANGYNCAETVSSSTTYGQRKAMYIELHVCQETSPGNNCNFISDDYDSGSYSYYAGPAGGYGKGHCISIDGSIYWNGHFASYGPMTAIHCG